jgi:hypothetical protein
MTFSALAPSTLHVAALRLLCTIGGCAGFTVILLGLRLDRKARDSSQECRPESIEANRAQEPAGAESRAPQEVVRLSTDQGPARSSEMSQQEKIAAALTRAGLGNAGWSPPEMRTASAVLNAPLSESATKPGHIPNAEPLPSQSGFNRNLVLLIGAMLALLSLILLLTLR